MVALTSFVWLLSSGEVEKRTAIKVLIQAPHRTAKSNGFLDSMSPAQVPPALRAFVKPVALSTIVLGSDGKV